MDFGALLVHSAADPSQPSPRDIVQADDWQLDFAEPQPDQKRLPKTRHRRVTGVYGAAATRTPEQHIALAKYMRACKNRRSQ